MHKIQRFFSSFLRKGVKPGTEEKKKSKFSRENLIVFGGAYVVALILWFVVNLNGVFNVSVQIPVGIGSLPADKALSTELPNFVSVDLTGEAMELIRIYNNPPSLNLNVEDREVNVFNQIRQQFNSIQNVDITKVEPVLINVTLEDKITKKIPVVAEHRISFQPRFGFTSNPRIVPDSITVSGASSIISEINEWVLTDTLVLENVRTNIQQSQNLVNTNPLVEINESSIIFSANVSEFTEGEVSAYIRTRNLPRGENITYNPSSITIKYDVPIDKFAEIQNMRLFEVYVSYSEIRDDFSGFVTPNLELIAPQYNIRLRSFQPKAVAYFSVVEQ